ncbi:Brix-domain-containing protein [Conidiobolus coronatus NRRL 28638]|uniref:Brix-domain-containing protein n=1 Tax=Conidiobolus coronatus (strain ATCC 28846 / CBS 209.66 / NRRL 28638) TaxID=796925 RepID=A0A137PB66_CONC2|nr:Brix-domain-containing protein [Conidiobolus coronatus NRRL 28638]|eukprot:KXN72260.1 Brix-domain-containing protein [Conidiobolus coronatus NRRL 28638]
MGERKSKANLNEIKSKVNRQQAYLKLKMDDAKKRKEMRIKRKKDEAANPEKKEKRLAENITRTIENTREHDDTMVDHDPDVLEEEAIDDFSEYFNGAAPKLLITTSSNAHGKIYDFCNELIDIFPNSEFIKRGKNFEVKQIVQFCINRNYTDLMIVNEDKRVPNAITLVHLPNGPTAYFKLSSLKLNSEIHNHGRSTHHKPEIILNNFNTRLGHTIGRMFNSLFPHVPEFQGRQVATFHNQRDFIFFRRHRYEFKSGERANLQEIGPRFTLKLRWLQKGTFDPDNGDYEWKHKTDMETSRRRFFL